MVLFLVLFCNDLAEKDRGDSLTSWCDCQCFYTFPCGVRVVMWYVILALSDHIYFIMLLCFIFLQDLSVDEMVRVRCFSCCQAHLGLPVGFFLLLSSVLCTVESLSLLYFLFISWFICSMRWCMDKLGVFYANQRSMCLDPHLN